MFKFKSFNILSLVDSFHSKTGGSNARLYRHRFVASLIISVLFYVSLIIFVATYFLPLGERSLYIIRVFFIFIGVGALLSIYILRTLNQRVFAVNTLISFLGLALIYLAMMTGGIESPAAICLIIFPAVAALSIDFEAGIIWGLLAALSWSLLFAAPYLGIPIQNAMPDVDDGLAFFVSIFTTHFFIAFVALYYNKTSKSLREKLLKERREYHYLANHDAHTGAINRRHFLELLKMEISRCEQSGSTFCLFFIDLNDFKKANDQYGHHFGDEILEVFSRRLRHRVREIDTVARIGGDEFCIISRDMGNEEDAKRGERRIEEILQEPLSLKEGKYTLKASIGWSIYPQHATDYEALLKYADQHMYEVKRLKKAARK
ncbi:MAG: GGDEF domain-containing protein [Zhongshania sp.]|jgi:diguanylate cyclase (GGDEF)-like protein|nr:GGDEF domain-containing protein [Zhongshania sp.]